MNLEENKKTWGECSYPGDGDCWARAWGGTEAQWKATIWPRICNMPHWSGPGGFVLEIGCGMGRHARRLAGPNGRGVYVGIDVVPKCVDHCRGKFNGLEEEFRFEHTGGLDVPLPNGSVDFVFSWDSLVHADREVIGAYLREIARVLRPGGRAFLHHSNLAACPLNRGGTFPRHARDETVSAAWVREKAEDAGGLRVVSQECVDWGATSYPIDCFTVLERSDDRPYPSPKLVENRDFMAEAHAARRIVELYG